MQKRPATSNTPVLLIIDSCICVPATDKRRTLPSCYMLMYRTLIASGLCLHIKLSLFSKKCAPSLFFSNKDITEQYFVCINIT